MSIKPQTSQNSVDDTDFYDEDYDLDDDEEEDNYYDEEDDDDDDDSGNGGEGLWCSESSSIDLIVQRQCM